MSLPNIWHHRKVADTSAKACEICYKPSTSVLITPDKQDFFYVCLVHLKDRGFCSPIIDNEAIAAKKKKEMDEEVERLKKEYEEKQRKKKEKEAEKEKDKDKDNEKDKQESKENEKEKDADKGEKKEASTADDKGKSKDMSPPQAEEEPRIFALQRVFYQRRLDRKRQAEMAKRNRERLSNPNFFPSVPKDLP
ncbi:DUF1742-domain-containing protein [Xylaria bambusicola]|uniref:DUF1742-domain-containing protein n=1 Tax=Xylaria bambusicola TaxID=326684 RepID=UPI0020073B76|nr:DUF1742-domain-containing protein [Xylaria bambusicola]KAI0513096.1 DUF1742-domain-containing protein [Xylaria bambusicola]